MAQPIDPAPKTDIPVQPAPIVGPRCEMCGGPVTEYGGCKVRCLSCGFYRS